MYRNRSSTCGEAARAMRKTIRVFPHKLGGKLVGFIY